jgi:hypothetical protein
MDAYESLVLDEKLKVIFSSLNFTIQTIQALENLHSNSSGRLDGHPLNLYTL